MISAPYFSQFASPELVDRFLQDPNCTAQDPRWADSGWSSRYEYAYWAWKTCGVACIRSIIGALGAPVPTAAHITRDLLQKGGYVPDDDTGVVHGLIYAAAVDYLSDRWGLQAQARPLISPEEVSAELEQPGHAVIASVAPTIRDLTVGARPHTGTLGGHLVLLTGMTDVGVVLHNPSGYWPGAQADVSLTWELFTCTFARRGITIDINTRNSGSKP